MKLSFIVFTVLCIHLGTFQNSKAQGCSDAGFCTLESFKPHSGEHTKSYLNQAKIGTFIGGADYSVFVYGAYWEYNRQINEKIGLDFKLTSLGQNGNDIQAFGLADLFVNTHIKLSENMVLTAGAKFPLMDASRSQDGLPLPMDYQASLGTLDLILGLGYQFEKIHVVAAIQQPLTQNENQFFSSLYPSPSPLNEIQSTNQFNRAGDMLIRVSYPYKVNSKLRLTPSLLPIYHFTEDTFTNATANEISIDGSAGLTLNANLYVDYELNETNSLQVNLGSPLLVREARPDGLTRGFVMNLEWRVRF